MLRRQAFNAVATALPFNDAVEVLGTRVKVAKHGMLSALNDVLLDRGHRGEVHVRHPHGNAIEALVGCVWSHAGDLTPRINGDGVHAVAVDKRAKVVFHAELPCKVDCFDRRYCPPAWAVLAWGLALFLTDTDGWLVLRVVDGDYGWLGFVDRKRYVEPGVGQMVDAVWFVLAARAARILA